jgi:hypothetical protein
MPAIRVIPLAMLAVASLALAGRPVALTLDAVSGAVQARGPGDWRPADPGQALEAGGAVRTLGTGRAVASLPGMVLGLEPGSHLDVVQVQGPPQVILARGALALVVEAAPAPLLVATPRGVAEIMQSGRYLLEAGDGARPTRLSVVAGEAHLLTAQGVMSAQTGEVAWVALDEVARMGPVGMAVQAMAWPARPAAPAGERAALAAAPARQAPRPVATPPRPAAGGPAPVARGAASGGP